MINAPQFLVFIRHKWYHQHRHDHYHRHRQSLLLWALQHLKLCHAELDSTSEYNK